MPSRIQVATDFGQVGDVTLSKNGLSFLPYHVKATALDQARPTWAGPVVWLVTYSPFAKPTNAVPGDHVLKVVVT